MEAAKALQKHQAQLRGCRRCAGMIPPVVTGTPVLSPVLLVGQAPGAKEGPLGRPFAWTAGKTLFKWFARIGLDEPAFRQRVYMSAVCRCFPGKAPAGGDRVPSKIEIARCGQWLRTERALLRPQLIIPVGKLAISQFIQFRKLTEVVGQVQAIEDDTGAASVVALPHPSGASTWHRTEPGITLLDQALGQIAAHPAWQDVLACKIDA